MDSLTDAVVFLNDKELPTDAFGNNAAFSCECGHPVLLVARQKGGRGVREEKPAKCRSCGCEYWTPSLEGDNKKVAVIQLKKK